MVERTDLIRVFVMHPPGYEQVLNPQASSSDRSHVPQFRSPLTSALLHLSDSIRALRLRLEENEGLVGRALAMTNEGAGASVVLGEIPAYAAQMAADEAMIALFEARDQVRKVVISAGLEDGMTVEQLATMFHLSPDVISAYVAERSNWFAPALSQRHRH